MIIDARTVPHRAALDTDICIVGAGPAGISLALEFDARRYRVMLLEGGDLKYDRAGQALYKGENVGIAYDTLDEARSRYFGGSSNCWGGFCRPLDTHDFEARDWVPNSGWPISRSDLLPFYRRAHRLLQLGPFEYEPAYWERRIDRPNIKLVEFDRQRVVNLILQYSPPTRFGEVYGEAIGRSNNITAYLNANVTEIETPGDGTKVNSIQVRTLSGAAFEVVARTFVLATGGIETPRLLLASNRYQPAGIANQFDLVGRYFMDHPRLCSGDVAFTNPTANSAVYDLDRTFGGRLTAASGTRIGGYFGLSPEVQREERLGSTRCYVKSRVLGDNPDTNLAAKRLFTSWRRGGNLLDHSGADLLKLLRQLPHVALLAANMKSPRPFLSRGLKLETVVEPTPLADSRVTLGADRDALGIPKVRVDWRLGDLEKRTILRTQQILAAELERVGAGNITVRAPGESDPWPSSLMGCWHHMGTTRMSADRRLGVVDPDCRVHGMENLFIAGSSVFPTCGSDMPTITIVALALRLADHIKSMYLGRQSTGTGESV